MMKFESQVNADEIIKELNSFALNGGYVFRGYGKQEELLPKILRKKCIEKEEALLMDFERYGSSFFSAMSPIDFMSYAQHFGIPTRLLDFTHNPFIALSFALYDPKEKAKDTDDYYYVRYARLKENICLPYIEHVSIYGRVMKPIDSLAEKACECIRNVKQTYEMKKPIDSLYTYKDVALKNKDQEKYDKGAIIFVDPNLANHRIIMQQGLFMFPYTLDKDEHLKILEDHSGYIMIHKDHREKLLSYLDTLGYNTFRLMPDLNSICGAIKRKHGIQN